MYYYKRKEYFMKRVSVDDVKKILSVSGLSNVDCEKLEMIKIGCQLHQLYKEDVIYMADSNTTVYAAQRRLAQRRREYE